MQQIPEQKVLGCFLKMKNKHVLSYFNLHLKQHHIYKDKPWVFWNPKLLAQTEVNQV